MNDHECKIWWDHYQEWRSNPIRKMHELQKKPRGFDLWLQGKNPLGLDFVAGYRCQGGGLVQNWTPSATPAIERGSNATDTPQ